MNNLPVLFHVVEGEVLSDVFVSPEDIAGMNKARAAFGELRSILLAQVVPALGGWDNPLAIEIECRIESVIFGTRNFLYPHRHAGAAHDASNVRGAK